LPMVAVMMVFSPLSGSLVNRVGPRRLISFGMIVTGIGTGLFLVAGVDVPFVRILPAFLVMGFGMSFIWAPMTTAVLNSVSSDKSGVASAVNGALREIGTAFGVALLGTLANRAYKTHFSSSADVQAMLTADGGVLKPLVDLVGEGMNLGGNVLGKMAASGAYPELAAVPPQVIERLEQISADAFMVGMDRAVVFSTVGIIAAAILSYFLIDDEVVKTPIEEHNANRPQGDVDFAPSTAD
ncbi:MAG: MFS transporter, partial [Thermomicrobiales bacterium]|nr:MFS transporter [Thermomicrobiales bacterium]